MDFSNAGTTEPVGAGFRAHVQWNDKGAKRHIHGPNRKDQQAAHEDLESMRTAASGMSREDGFAAMKAEADQLKAGKKPKEVGFVQSADNAFRARVQYRAEGALRDIPGPWRPDEEAAKADLASMRSAASGMRREDGFAAMDADAKRLIAGKAPKAEGSVKRFSVGFSALIRWKVGGEERRAYGPRRSDERRAREDLDVMREASASHEDVLASRKAVDTEVRRLQQQAEDEVRVSAVARRLSQEQRQQQQVVEQRQQQPYVPRPHPVEDDTDSQSDWEPGDADDADVVYAWERFDVRGRPLPEEEQQPAASSVPQPEPKTPDEATAMLAKFRPIRSTPEDLQLLLEARADPNMTVGEGNISPMENIMTFAREIHVPRE
jgi:hypothetical protein